MPYITQKRRRLINRGHAKPESAGELNYAITRMILDYLERQETSYQTMNDIVGALDNAKDEFRRRIQHPYEDHKKEENGDVYPKE